MACWENAEFYFYYYYYLFISLCSYGDFFCALKHQHQTSRWKIGRWNRWTRNFLCFYSMTFWKISEIVEELVLLLNIKTISHKFWNEAQGIYLPQLNRKLLLYLDALVYNVPFFLLCAFFPRGSPVPCCLQSTLLRLLLLLWTCKHFLHRI